MEQYSIYCTRKQTKKVLELGAPLRKIEATDEASIKAINIIANGSHKEEYTLINNTLIINPTAEQMLGWLEEQGITIESVRCDMFWFARSYSDENTNFNKGRFKSRKEAILAAIDAALDYLRNK